MFKVAMVNESKGKEGLCALVIEGIKIFKQETFVVATTQM
jgi:hypothetical protein